MKNTILKVVQQNDFDRYVFITYKYDEIVGLNFWQGIGKESYENIMSDNGFEPCASLTEIFNRLKNNVLKLNDEERINKAIDLYIHAFIFQDNEPLVKHAYDVKSKHLIFLEGYIDAWERLKDTSPNEDWIEGANAIYVAYCELHNLPKLCADDLIFELNKI